MEGDTYGCCSSVIESYVRLKYDVTSVANQDVGLSTPVRNDPSGRGQPILGLMKVFLA